jgi:hypothetical protein
VCDLNLPHEIKDDIKTAPRVAASFQPCWRIVIEAGVGGGLELVVVEVARRARVD